MHKEEGVRVCEAVVVTELIELGTQICQQCTSELEANNCMNSGNTKALTSSVELRGLNS